jgi:hypothetical protein
MEFKGPEPYLTVVCSFYALVEMVKGNGFANTNEVDSV